MTDEQMIYGKINNHTQKTFLRIFQDIVQHAFGM